MSGQNMKGIAPWHQTNWDWRAAGNFIGGGSGTGLLMWAAVAGGDAYRWLALFALALVGCGLACVWLEIGRPLRAINVFRHPQTSWMTREGLAAPFLFAAALAAAVQNGGPFAWLAAAIAVFYLYCQARMLLASKGIPAWRAPRMLPLIVVTALTEGAGWLALCAGLLGAGGAAAFGAPLLLLAPLRYWAWKRYLAQLRAGGAPLKALAVLEGIDLRFALGANAAPAALVLLAVALDTPAVGALAGVLAALGGWWLKYTIVARAAFNQGFALPKLPVRGVGVPAPGVKPGWSAPAAPEPPPDARARGNTTLRNA